MEQKLQDIYQEIKTLPQATQLLLLRELKLADIKDQIAELPPVMKGALVAKLMSDKQSKKNASSSSSPTATAKKTSRKTEHVPSDVDEEDDDEGDILEEGPATKSKSMRQEHDDGVEMARTKASSSQQQTPTSGTKRAAEAISKGSKVVVRCSLCGIIGHLKNDCWSKLPKETKKKRRQNSAEENAEE